MKKTKSKTENDYRDLLESIRLLLLRNGGESRTFGSVVQEYTASMQTEHRMKSCKLYRVACGRLMKYMKRDFALSELTPLHIQGLADELYREGVSETTVRIYLTLVRVVLNYAVKMNYVGYRVHPFALFRLPPAAVRERDLSVEELKHLRDLPLFGEPATAARDVFMLTYYLGGINLRDLLAYDFRGKNCMSYVRHKTSRTRQNGGEIVFTIQPEAHLIIYKYMGADGKLSFGRYHTYEQIYSLVYRYIGRIAALAGIERKVSYYSARKSFAQHAYNAGFRIEQIEYCIGHSMKSNRPIFNYVRIMREQADCVFRTILDQLL